MQSRQKNQQLQGFFGQVNYTDWCIPPIIDPE